MSTYQPKQNQLRRLVRTPDLTSFRRTLAELALQGEALAARRRALLLPTAAATELLRESLERGMAQSGRTAAVMPDLITRDVFFARLHEAVPGAGPMLSRLEREVLLGRAAREAAARPRVGGRPFEIRPGLVAEMLALYDEIRRRRRTVTRFAGKLFEQLDVERGMDRGSDNLIQQTAFLGFAFLGYERAVAASGALDEHILRSRLLAADPPLPFDHLVIAVADHPADPRGLWPADFDLIGRLAGLRAIDVVVTDETHDAGFRQRIEEELPGIVEATGHPAGPQPVVIRPQDSQSLCLVSTDREEELREVARTIRHRTAATGHRLDARVAVVFHRPLPYLYLAPQVLTDARVPFQTFDALPLAAEPYAALVDQVLDVARTGGTREATLALLRSGLVRFEVDGEPVDASDVGALERVLSERRASGEAGGYLAEVDAYEVAQQGRSRVDAVRARRAAAAARDLHAELQGFRTAITAAEQIAVLARFLRRHGRAPAEQDPVRERQLRARAAVLGVLDGLSAACLRHDNEPRSSEELTAFIHHVLEGQTFARIRRPAGVHLVDAMAARFGEYDHVHLVGLVETDWPERPRRSIFYTSGLLASLGWPQDVDQRRAERAAFRDLIRLPSQTLHLHAFRLEGDALLTTSPLLDEANRLPARDADPVEAVRVFPDEVLAGGAPPASGLEDTPARWLACRLVRPAMDDLRYSGRVAAQAPRTYRVSQVDRYVDCPFKYFAASVLRLDEEREDAEGLTPLERGTLVHTLFEQFYRQWQAEGRGTITAATLPEAVEWFGRLTREALGRLPAADRSLEDARLLGSLVARGVAERVFELEAESGGQIVDRLLEEPLRGSFVFPLLHGFDQKSIAISGKADRVDVFADGSLRVIDYKSGKLPDVASAVQVGVYAHCVGQMLAARDGRSHVIREAMYLAFGDEDALEGRLSRKTEPADVAVHARASAFAGVVNRIEAGEFPARPRRVGDCQWCAFAGVCRKEYVPEEHASAGPV